MPLLETTTHMVFLVLFAVVQIIAIVSFFVIRYHYALFGIPHDVTALRMLRVYATGLIVFCFVSGWFISKILS